MCVCLATTSATNPRPHVSRTAEGLRYIHTQFNCPLRCSIMHRGTGPGRSPWDENAPPTSYSSPMQTNHSLLSTNPLLLHAYQLHKQTMQLSKVFTMHVTLLLYIHTLVVFASLIESQYPYSYAIITYIVQVCTVCLCLHASLSAQHGCESHPLEP